MKRTIRFLSDELWYGGVIGDSEQFPLSDASVYYNNLSHNFTSHQINPVFLSSQGRYIWMGEGGEISFDNGTIVAKGPLVETGKAGDTLKEVATAAAFKYYKPTGTTPDIRAFAGPQYCSWVVLLWHQNQEGILSYARSIVEKGYKPGLLIIDDSWQRNYGVWEFDANKFPNPHAMIKELKDMGFLVSLWMCPYVTLDAPYLSPGIFEHMQDNRVIMDGDRPYIFYWWEGYSAQLDFTRPNAKKWINEQTKRLEREYGIDGYKLDGPYMFEKIPDVNKHSSLWFESIDNPLKEARSCWKLAGQPIIQRLNDKRHLWKSPKDEERVLGLSSIIPGIAMQGLVGYYYGCADMVGGGCSGDFIDTSDLDKELIIRWCQASVLFPMVQFSYDVWNHPEEGLAEYCKKAFDIRMKFTPYIIKLLKEASVTGVPAVRLMEYEFPHQGFGRVMDQFMLGEKYLVAPVLDKGARCRKVFFPQGKWRDIENGEIFESGAVTVDAPIDKLPVFEKAD